MRCRSWCDTQIFIGCMLMWLSMTFCSVLMCAPTAEEEEELATARTLEVGGAVIDGEELLAPATSEHGQV